MSIFVCLLFSTSNTADQSHEIKDQSWFQKNSEKVKETIPVLQ